MARSKKVCPKGTRRVKKNGKVRCQTKSGKLKAPRKRKSSRKRR